MKTLDEVIHELEESCVQTQKSDGYEIYYLEDVNLKDDALHYLKEYRRDCEELVEAAKSLTKKEHELAVEDKNDPLTWDELREMEGKPVWVEYDGYTPDWEVIENVGATRSSISDFTGNFIETHMSILHKEDMGKTWQAYRKERHDREKHTDAGQAGGSGDDEGLRPAAAG